MEVIKWLATIGLNALVHILHVPVTENAANVWLFTEEAGKFQVASFQQLEKARMTDQ